MNSVLDLQGLRVLVTRPEPLGSVLSDMINAHHGHALFFPTIAIVPLSHINFAALAAQDWLIFTSQYAVEMSTLLIHEVLPHFPAQIKIAAVGNATAKCLEEAGYANVLSPQKNWSSEGLLALREMQQMNNLSVMLVSGKGGRDLLAQTLCARGATVTKIAVYERVLPRAKWSVRYTECDVIVITSGDVLLNLKKMATINWDLIQTIPLVVASQRIKTLAQDLGFQTIWVAENASNHSLLEMLATIRMNHAR